MSDHERGSEERPFHIEGSGIVFEKPKSQEEIARERREKEQHQFARAQVITNERLAWFTGLLVVGTFFGTAIGIWQATISRTAANAARDAVGVASQTLAQAQKDNTQQRLDNAAAALDAKALSNRNIAQSVKALQATIDNFHQDQRAWVGFDSTIPGDFSPTTGFPVEVDFINSGKTPARSVRLSPAFFITADPAPLKSLPPNGLVLISKTFIDRPAIPPLGKVRHLIGANSPTPNQPSKNEEIRARFDLIKMQKQLIYYFGIIEYKDVFGKNHRTQYCVYLTNPETKEFSACGFFNDLN